MSNIIITYRDGDNCETKRFEGDELTSSEGQAILWLKEQDAERSDIDLEKAGGA